MLLRMIAPTSARLICREMTATLLGGRCTNGRKDRAYASTKLTASALVDPCTAPGSDGRERGKTRLTMHCGFQGAIHTNVTVRSAYMLPEPETRDAR